MKSNLIFIHSNYRSLPLTITKLESQRRPLTDSVALVLFTKRKLNEVVNDGKIQENKRFSSEKKIDLVQY